MVDEFGQDLVVIGKYIGDIDRADQIVKGTYKFTNDYPLQNKLYGRILGSPHAHAKVLSIDTSAAEALDGVEAVITCLDEEDGWSTDGWTDTVLCWGQEVAAVAAIDEYTAERALLLIKVEYDVMDFNLHPDDAMKPNAPITGTWEDTNVGSPSTWDRGDIEAGFADATVIVEEEMGWGRPHTQNTIEPDTGVAWWDGDDVYGYDTNQNPHSSNRSYANALGLPIGRCHIRVRGAGGGFGGGGQSEEPITAAKLAKKAGKPVQIIRPRRIHTPPRRNHYGPHLKMRLGWNENTETLTAIECIWHTWGGKNGSRGGYNQNLDTTFMCDNIRYESYGVATNTGYGAGYR